MSAAAETEKVRVGRQVRVGVMRDLKSHLSGVDSVVVARLDKVTARDVNMLRGALKPHGSTFLIVKNSLCRLTFQEAGWVGLEGALEGTCGISPVKGDISQVCKLLATFSKDHEGFVLKGGVLAGQVIGSSDLKALAKLPSRQVLLSQLAGVAQSLLRSLAFVFQAPIRQLAVVLKALSTASSTEGE